MNAQKQRNNTAPAVAIIVIILLAVLGIGLYFLLNKPAPKEAPAPAPAPEVTKPADPAPAAPAETTPKVLGIHTVIPRDTLWWISDKWYQDPVLWPSIYEINRGQIADPDLIFPGQKFDIPALSGSKENLSAEDKTLLAQGYLEAYRVYKEKGKRDAADYKAVSEKLAPATK